MIPISKPPVPLKNRILLTLPESDRQTLLAEADRIQLPIGHTLARAGDPISSAFFPDTGVIALMSEMTTGHQVAVAAIGAEGMIGLGPIFSLSQYLQPLVVFVDSTGFRVPAGRFHDVFERSELLRHVTLAHVGRKMNELIVAAACNRVHSHRQRLARWLLTTSDKAHLRSLNVTHEALAQMVGGPRHAVTVALNELRAKGAIMHLRGRIDITNRSLLVAQACECYSASVRLVRK